MVATLKPAREELEIQVRLLSLALAKLSLENEQLRELAHCDALTGLANRRGFETHLDHEIRTARRYKGSVALLILDLDGMKTLNDHCGHPAGDAALRDVGNILRDSVRTCDEAARLGGDEFAIVLPATDEAGARTVAERIRARVAALDVPGGQRLTASIGVAVFSAPWQHPERMVSRADRALYLAKREGKNRVVVADRRPSVSLTPAPSGAMVMPAMRRG
jgi:diguanylate cyclase (GGDEF)-like protein